MSTEELCNWQDRKIKELEQNVIDMKVIAENETKKCENIWMAVMKVYGPDGFHNILTELNHGNKKTAR